MSIIKHLFSELGNFNLRSPCYRTAPGIQSSNVAVSRAMETCSTWLGREHAQNLRVTFFTFLSVALLPYIMMRARGDTYIPIYTIVDKHI